MSIRRTGRARERFRPAGKATGSGFWLLLLMVTIYPLIVVPYNKIITIMGVSAAPGYFYAPRYLVLLAVAAPALCLLVRERVRLDHPAVKALIAFIALALFATVLAPVPASAWFGLPTRYTGFTTYLGCLILFLLATNSPGREQLLTAAIIGASVVAIPALLQYLGLNIIPHEYFREGFISYSTMGNPDFLGTYMAFLLPGAVMRYLEGEKKSWLIPVALLGGGLVTSLCRGAWLASALVLITVAVYAWKENKMKPLLIVLVLLAGTTLLLLPFRNGVILTRFGSIGTELSRAIVIPQKSPAGQEKGKRIMIDDQAGAFRTFIWKAGLRLLKTHWLVGIGPDHLGYYQIRTPQDGALFDKAHDIYLEIALTMGIPALLAYLAFLLLVLRATWRRRLFILTAMIGAYLLQGLTNIDVVMILPVFWIVLGLALNRKGGGRSAAKSPPTGHLTAVDGGVSSLRSVWQEHLTNRR